MKIDDKIVRRLCKVGDRFGLFHTWEFYSHEEQMLSPRGLYHGVGQATKRTSQVFGIIEFEDGIERVDPVRIKFWDEEHDILVKLGETLKREMMDATNKNKDGDAGGKIGAGEAGVGGKPGAGMAGAGR